jgi:formylglycine-generating enzyme required for sulfatase activity
VIIVNGYFKEQMPKIHKRIYIWFLLLIVIAFGILTADTWLRIRDMNWNILRIWTLVHVGLYDGPSMIEIPAGTFLMGDSNCIDGERRKECPQHTVTIKSFWMGKYEVTFDEYSAFALDSKNVELPGHSDFGRGKRPVINVSWEDAKRYTEWLTKVTGKPYRLPTEAEWEYACRAGGKTEFYFGDDVKRMKEFVWFSENSGVMTHPVGEKMPNAWGLYDMHGNVWEWVEDTWSYNYHGVPNDGKANESFSLWFRVIRGGAYYSTAQQCRSATRSERSEEMRSDFVGFRMSRSSSDNAPIMESVLIPTESAKQDFLLRLGLSELPTGYQIYYIIPINAGGKDSPDNMQLLIIDHH